MKKMDINKQFTEIVAAYLMEGYTINTQSMSGHQGEDGKVDLVKGDELIRVWLNSESSSYKDWYDENAWHDSVLVLRVGRWKYPAKEASYRTVWMSELETFQTLTYYAITRSCCDGWYVNNKEEAITIQKMRSERSKDHHMARNDNSPMKYYVGDERVNEIACRYLKRKKGYQRVSRNDIVVVRNRDNSFRINYHGNTYFLR